MKFLFWNPDGREAFGIFLFGTVFAVKIIAMTFDITVTKTNKYCYFNAIYNGERIGKVCVDLSSDDANRYVKAYGGKWAKVVIVETSSSYCGKGVATALLRKVVEVLGDYNLYLNVVPLKRNSADKDKSQLIDFYSKFGFKKYEGDICVSTMVRVIDL